MPKLVLMNAKGRSFAALAAYLGEHLGYRVRRNVSHIVGRYSIWGSVPVDKVVQFQRFANHGISSPMFVTALSGVVLLPSRLVVVRELTQASEGRGITICDKNNCVIEAPLYTEYIPKKKEFRVHIWDNEVIDVQEKRKKRDFEDERDTQVRNKANGYVFCRINVVEPDDLRGLALAAVGAIERTSGAVDVIWNERLNKCFVLEVNSRPGMEGQTLEKYADAILAEYHSTIKRNENE